MLSAKNTSQNSVYFATDRALPVLLSLCELILSRAHRKEQTQKAESRQMPKWGLKIVTFWLSRSNNASSGKEVKRASCPELYLESVESNPNPHKLLPQRLFF
jgi:hypothetical protein